MAQRERMGLRFGKYAVLTLHGGSPDMDAGQWQTEDAGKNSLHRGEIEDGVAVLRVWARVEFKRNQLRRHRLLVRFPRPVLVTTSTTTFSSHYESA